MVTCVSMYFPIVRGNDYLPIYVPVYPSFMNFLLIISISSIMLLIVIRLVDTQILNCFWRSDYTSHIVTKSHNSESHERGRVLGHPPKMKNEVVELNLAESIFQYSTHWFLLDHSTQNKYWPTLGCLAWSFLLLSLLVSIVFRQQWLWKLRCATFCGNVNLYQ